MGSDALDRIRPGKWSKEQKKEFARQKAEQEEIRATQDPKSVQEGSRRYREIVAEQLKRAGLR